MQKNASSKRFGAISYTLDNSPTRDGGVLRSNMKYVGPTLPDGTTNSAKEYGTDGIFINPPLINGLHSGIINYINKFSEPGYKSYDPIGELFYEGIRYFKRLAPTPEYSSGITRSASDTTSGGFWFANSASDWQDPMQHRCQKNFVIAINDANPWLDKKLPGTFFSSSSFVGASGTVNLSDGDYGEPSNADHTMHVRTLTNKVGDLEGLNGTTWSSTGTWTSGTVSGTNDSVGGGVGTYADSCTPKTVAKLGEVMGTCPSPAKQNSYYIAGLAYYANTTDLRSDFANDRGIQNVQSFFIDTQEYSANPLDGPKNMLWLAGKYGGFVDANGDGIPQTSEWDADGDGVPDNYVLATQPQNLIDGLNQAFAFIDQRTSSASSASVNSGSISSDSRVYQARFNSANWTGELLSYQVNSDGSLTDPDDPGNWEAVKKIPASGLRQIITTNSNGAAVPFAWSNLDSTRRGQLHANTTTAQDTLNYLRGDASKEVANQGTFRDRASKLGDIVNSVPVFVGRPIFTHPDTLESQPYSAFRSAQKNRTGVVYVGANDGMLHAFNATDGTEIFAYIPGPVFPKLKDLTSRSYRDTHQFFVDGLPTMGDVFFNNAWHTVLVGGLNQGGQGMYALDITTPANLTEANAASLVLWEFTDANDKDLGYTFTQPSIVRLHNGQWAAVFGNGYNNLQNDGAGRVSTTGYAVLYIVNIQTGSVIRKISTQAGAVSGPPNGLATPAVVDLDGDAIADYVFAGDLLGNMWKFDIRDTNPANWRVAYTDGSGKPAPLYVAKDSATSPNPQPITNRPEVGRGPGGVGMLVLFGTGKYLEPTDKQLPPQTPRRDQSFYGIIDTNTIVSGRNTLQRQTIDVETTVTVGGHPYNVRVTSKNKGSNVDGWYIDLVSPAQGYQAEKQVSRPLLRNGRIIFTTLIPDPDPCNFGGTSWLMEMDALTGSRLEQSPFDLLPDNQFSDEDMVTVTVNGTPVTVPVSGVQSTVGITPMPGVMVDPERPVEYKYTPGTSGEIAVIVENPGTDSAGRKAWRQLQ
jgi:type IV pilus assembly protein PilY1